MATGIIAPIKKGVGDEYTLYGSLLKNGYYRAPGATLTLSPKKEKGGKYRTGLDEDAFYIQKLGPAEAEAERARVRAWREKCEEYYHVPLGPRDPFYTEMSLNKKNQPACPIYRLSPKEEMIFDLEDPEQLVIYAYLRVHSTFVASSYDAYQSGRVEDPQKVCYYVKDEEVEAARKWQKNREMNKAIASLENSNPIKQLNVARSLGLGVTDSSQPTVVYNLLNDYIKQGVLEQGYYKGAQAVAIFNSFMDMKDDNLKVFSNVNKAIVNNIYRKDPSGTIKKADRIIGKNVEEAVKFLLSPEGQEDLLILEAELNQKSELPKRKSAPVVDLGIEEKKKAKKKVSNDTN